MELGLKDKVALVTGASGGIGAAIAAELAREGMQLCLTGRDAARLRQAADAADALSGHASSRLEANLTQPEAAPALVAAALAAHGRIDLLVNCAGATKRGDFTDLSEADWQDGFALKFHGAVRLTRAAWPHLRAAGGAIVNIIGTGSRSGSAEFTIGGSVNVALLNFTKAMADLGIEEGVRVNAINPGIIATERFERTVAQAMKKDGTSREQATAGLIGRRRIRRAGRPEEIGWLTAFLASDKADYIQGAIIDIDGGSNRHL